MNWTNIYNWVKTVVGNPPGPIAGSGSYSTTWSPTEVLAYAAALCILLMCFKILFWVIRRLFGPVM